MIGITAGKLNRSEFWLQLAGAPLRFLIRGQKWLTAFDERHMRGARTESAVCYDLSCPVYLRLAGLPSPSSQCATGAAVHLVGESRSHRARSHPDLYQQHRLGRKRGTGYRRTW